VNRKADFYNTIRIYSNRANRRAFPKGSNRRLSTSPLCTVEGLVGIKHTVNHGITIIPHLRRFIIVSHQPPDCPGPIFPHHRHYGVQLFYTWTKAHLNNLCASAMHHLQDI